MGDKENFIKKLKAKGESTVRGEFATYHSRHKRWANVYFAEEEQKRIDSQESSRKIKIRIMIIGTIAAVAVAIVSVISWLSD